MSQILKLQQLNARTNDMDMGNLFGSAISTVCPPPGTEGIRVNFEME